jgi:hypothetical protein
MVLLLPQDRWIKVLSGEHSVGLTIQGERRGPREIGRHWPQSFVIAGLDWASVHGTRRDFGKWGKSDVKSERSKNQIKLERVRSLAFIYVIE